MILLLDVRMFSTSPAKACRRWELDSLAKRLTWSACYFDGLQTEGCHGQDQSLIQRTKRTRMEDLRAR